MNKVNLVRTRHCLRHALLCEFPCLSKISSQHFGNNYTRRPKREDQTREDSRRSMKRMHTERVRARGTSRYLDAKAKAGFKRASPRQTRAHTAYTARGLLMSASQSGNFSTSRRVMHEPRGASRLYCPINQNEPGMATAVSTALRSESLFPATVEARGAPA